MCLTGLYYKIEQPIVNTVYDFTKLHKATPVNIEPNIFFILKFSHDRQKCMDWKFK